MGMPASPPATATAPAEPVPVAFLGRTSTLLMQDPRASLQRQLREVKGKPGCYEAVAHLRPHLQLEELRSRQRSGSGARPLARSM